MTPIITLIAATGILVLVVVLMRANAGVMFLAACTGLVLLQSLDPTVLTTAGAIVPGEGEAYVRLAVVLASVLFAALMFRETVQGGLLFLHALIAVLCGLTLWLILPSATGISWLLANTSDGTWKDVDAFQTIIIAAGFSLSLLTLLLSKPRHAHGKHGKR